MSLDQRICVVTGATGGIGGALAQELARAGARLILAGRDADALAALAAQLPTGAVLDCCAGDLTQRDAQSALVASASVHGADTLINVAGSNELALFAEQSPAVIEGMLKINLLGPMLLSQRFLPLLSSRSTPMIVNIGSAFGSIGYPGYAGYCASKFGLRGFSEALAREYADSALKVIHVAPRATRTAMNADRASALNQALGSAEDAPEAVAKQIVRAMRKGRQRSAIGWPERFFAWLNQVQPRLVDRALARDLATIRTYAGRNDRTEDLPARTQLSR